MKIKTVTHNTKEAATLACAAYVIVRASQGWYYLGRDLKESIAERRAAKKSK